MGTKEVQPLLLRIISIKTKIKKNQVNNDMQVAVWVVIPAIVKSQFVALILNHQITKCLRGCRWKKNHNKCTHLSQKCRVGKTAGLLRICSSSTNYCRRTDIFCLHVEENYCSDTNHSFFYMYLEPMKPVKGKIEMIMQYNDFLDAS